MRRKVYAAFLMLIMMLNTFPVWASSHREAPLIANDPLTDNTDLYAFRNPDNPDKIIIIANYIPGQLPQGGPNFYHFGENIRYEIHIDNDVSNNTYFNGDDIIYRFTFKRINQDPGTFFNVRLGMENLKTTYMLERSIDGGITFQEIVTDGIVPAPNIGDRSILSAVGLNAGSYNELIESAVTTASTGEKVFCGTADDPFFVDLGGIFDLGDAPRVISPPPADGLACKNISSIVLEVDIATLQKDNKSVNETSNILDPDYIIGVWASASRQKIRTLNTNGTQSFDGAWVQVSRLGMPLTNEVVIGIGNKDLWNSLTPYQEAGMMYDFAANNPLPTDQFDIFSNYLYNPELALYMDDSQFGGAIPALKPLRIQTSSLGAFDFRNGKDGLFALKNSPAVTGTALDDAVFGKLLLPGPSKPRSVDLWPIFHSGVPNLIPYQLATGKGGNPLAAGKPFINNFLPNGGDMLRLNMAVPPTPRNSTDFSSLGLIQAAVLGLTDLRFNTDTDLEFIPNMDGFPNGRRLEDDVTRIELQAVSGIVLAAIGLPYDDYVPGGSLATPDLLNVLTYSTSIEANDTMFRSAFPYLQAPWSGTHPCACEAGPTGFVQAEILQPSRSSLGISPPEMFITSSPNPFPENTTIRYRLDESARILINLYDSRGSLVKVLVNNQQEAGTYSMYLNTSNLPDGVYIIKASKNGIETQSLRIVKN